MILTDPFLLSVFYEINVNSDPAEATANTFLSFLSFQAFTSIIGQYKK